MKKRFLSLILALFCALTTLSFTACGGKDNSIVIFAAAEEERIAFLQNELDEKFPNYEIIIQSVGTGEFFTKLQGEKQNIDCDIFFDLEVSNAERLIAEVPNLFYDLSSYDYSKYVANTKDFTDRHHYYAIDCKTDLAFIVNKTVLGNNIPATYNDLLDPMYKDLIVMPDPKTSGTGYSFLSGMVAKVGEINALNYFASLDNNVKEYTTSGSAPMKSVNRGDAGIGVCMLWQGVNYKNANSNLEVVILDDITPYALYGMGIVNTHETKTGVLEVFEYLFNEANQKCVEEFNTGNLYVGQAPSTTPNFPANVNEIDLSAVIYDYNYKTSLIDKWTF